MWKLTYFNLTGLGESIRLMLSYGGVKFEDRRVSFEEWPTLKSQIPMGQMPVLEIDGKKYHQSKAIMRLLGKKFHLYGSSEDEEYEIDAAADGMDDMRQGISGWYWEQDAVYKEKLKEAAFKKLTSIRDHFETQVKNNGGYFVNGKLSWADVLYAGYTDYMSNVLGHDLNKDHPELKKLVEKVRAIPSIKAYREKRPEVMI